MESDVYAFGVLLWEIVTHDEPYKGLSDFQIMGNLYQNKVHMHNLINCSGTAWVLTAPRNSIEVS